MPEQLKAALNDSQILARYGGSNPAAPVGYDAAVLSMSPKWYWPISSTTISGGNYVDSVDAKEMVLLGPAAVSATQIMDDDQSLDGNGNSYYNHGIDFGTGDVTMIIWIKRTGAWDANKPTFATRSSTGRNSLVIGNPVAGNERLYFFTNSAGSGYSLTNYYTPTLNEVSMAVLRYTASSQLLEGDVFEINNGHMFNEAETATAVPMASRSIACNFYADGSAGGQASTIWDAPAFFDSRLTDAQLNTLFEENGGTL